MTKQDLLGAINRVGAQADDQVFMEEDGSIHIFPSAVAARCKLSDPPTEIEIDRVKAYLLVARAEHLAVLQ